MNISVVIPTANRPDRILKAIEKIYENTVLPHEVIVVDQSQDDATATVLAQSIERGKVTYIKDEGTGISRSKNIGWQYTSGEIVAFTDDDAWVESTWLENIKSSFIDRQFKIGVLGGKIIPVYEEKNLNWTCPERWLYLLPASDLGEVIGNYDGDSTPPGVNFSIYRSLLEKFSGFDEKLGVNNGRLIQIFGEDKDLSCRIKKAGYDLIYNPSCIVYHPVPLSRQSQNFLDKRLIQEGMTYAYFKIEDKEIKAFACCLALIKSFSKYMYLKLTGSDKNYAQFLQGKMIALLKFGILRMQLQ